MRLYKLFYSEDQKGQDCCPEVLVNGRWIPYTEWTEGDHNKCKSNWEDARIVYQGTEKPTTRYNRCGYCIDCEMFR